MQNFEQRLQLFLTELKEIDGKINKEEGENIISTYHKTTLGFSAAKPSVVLLPENKKQIVNIVNTARKHQVKYYCISQGKNWGFGDALPADEECDVILNLRNMNAILDFDEELGLVNLEPGVTFAQLRHFLFQKKSQFLAPVIGGGDSGSVIGNLLERGHALTPSKDRVSTLVSLEAILPDGSLYSSYGSYKIPYFSQGMGSNLDGLFVQSSFGIVTKVTLQLDRKMEKVRGIFVDINSYEDLKVLLARTRDFCQLFGDTLVSFRFVTNDYLLKHTDIPISINDLPYGLFMIAIGGESEIVNLVVNRITRDLSEYKISSYDAKYIGSLYRALFFLKKNSRVKLTLAKMSTMSPFLFSCNGLSFEPLYIYKHFQIKDRIPYERLDNIGLIMFYGTLPFKEEGVISFFTKCENISKNFIFEKLYTFSSNTKSSIFLTFPLLFEKNNIEQRNKAWKAYYALVDALYLQGGAVQRLPILAMDIFPEKNDLKLDLIKKIKYKLDPNNLYNSKRYSK